MDLAIPELSLAGGIICIGGPTHAHHSFHPLSHSRRFIAGQGSLQSSNQEREMAITVYGPPQSGATARVVAVLEEKELEYELVNVSMPTGEHKQPPHLARNPFGQVPALQDGDLVLFESRAITRYIETKYKGKGPDLLRSDSLGESALVNVWMEVEALQFDPPVGPIAYNCLFVPMFGGVADEKAVAANVEKLEKVLDVYESRLSKTKYLAGDFYSLADLNHVPTIHYLMATPHRGLIHSRPHVKAWWEEISARAASKKAIAGMFFSS